MAEIQVGFPVVEDAVMTWMVTPSATEADPTPAPVERAKGVKRTTGVRYMRPELLQKLVKWMNANNFSDAAGWVGWWLDQSAERPKGDADALIKRLEARVGQGKDKDDHYIEAIIFCVRAHASNEQELASVGDK